MIAAQEEGEQFIKSSCYEEHVKIFNAVFFLWAKGSTSTSHDLPPSP